MLTELVPELFNATVSFLDLPSICALRLASRDLEQLTRGLFAIAAFSTAVTDFSKPSRNRLTNIAAHASFRLAVRRIEVKNHTTSSGRSGPDRDHVPGYDDDCIWPRCTETYYGEKIDVSSKRVKQVAEALLCFPNCTRAVIPDYENLGPVSPRHARRKSLINYNLIQKEDLSSDDAAEILLHAYSLPGAPPIRSFQALLREDTEKPASLKLTKATLDAVRKNWETHLEDLVLQFPSWGNTETFRLITNAHSLTSLRIVWNERWEIKINGPPGLKLFRHLNDSPDFAPPLRTLALGGITLGEEGDLLPRFLSRFQDTLVSLAFSELSLTPGAWKSVLGYLTAFPKLESLSIYNCTEGANNLVFCKLCASRDPQNPCGTFGFAIIGAPEEATHINGVLFKSTPGNFKAGLQAIIDNCTVVFEEGGNSPCCRSAIVKYNGHVSGPLSPQKWWTR